MITHDDLYSGAFGRLRNAGGARMYTTPHTISVPPKYTIDINQDVQGELVANSLDGRLWLYRNGGTINAVALKWNASAGELELAAVKSFSNNNDVMLARGFDWILTNNHIFMVSDDSPYIFMSKLFEADIPDTFLYSILRHKDVGSSGYDTFTNQAWGMRDDNGNSEGLGYFSKDTHLLYPAGTHKFEQCYSLLPPVGDWQIFENFLIRRSNAESINSYNYMKTARPLIPLEFYNGTATYGTGYNLDHRGLQLFHKDGEIWGRGLYNAGRVYILPAVFDTQGEPVEFYLYISSNYMRSQFLTSNLGTVNDWLNIGIMYIDAEYLYGFLSEQADAVSSGACLTASNTQLLSLQNNEWVNLSEYEGKMFIDTENAQALILYEDGVGLVHNVASGVMDYQCNNLPQWLVPAGKVEAVTDDYVVASADRSSFCTSLVTGFNRYVISPCILPLSASTFVDKQNNYSRVVIQEITEENIKTLAVHHLSSRINTTQNIDWTSIYKEAITIKLDSVNSTIDIDKIRYIGHDNTKEYLKYGHYNWERIEKNGITYEYHTMYFDDHRPEESITYPPWYLDRVSFDIVFYLGYDEFGEEIWVTGPHIDFSPPHILTMETHTSDMGNFVICSQYFSNNSRIYGLKTPTIYDSDYDIEFLLVRKDGDICLYMPELMTDEWVYFPICSMSSIINSIDASSYSENYSRIRFVKSLEENRFFIFEEVDSKITFTCDISNDSSLVSLVKEAHIDKVLYRYSETTSDLMYCLIILQNANGDVPLNFQIELHPEVFNFKQELERSIPS